MEIKAVSKVSQLSSHWKRILNISWQVRDKNIYCKRGTAGTDGQAWREVKYCLVLTSAWNLTGAKLGSNISSSSLTTIHCFSPIGYYFSQDSDPFVFLPWKRGMCFQLYPNVEYDSSHRFSTKSQQDGVFHPAASENWLSFPQRCMLCLWDGA